jgi:hypothetical protein
LALFAIVERFALGHFGLAISPVLGDRPRRFAFGRSALPPLLWGHWAPDSDVVLRQGCLRGCIPHMIAEGRRTPTIRCEWEPSVQAIFLLPVLLLGACVGGTYTPANQMPPVDVGRFDAEDGQKNLTAIREMLGGQPSLPHVESHAEIPRRPGGEPTVKQPSESGAQAAPPQGHAQISPSALVPPLSLPTPPHRPSQLPSRLDLGIGPMNPYRPQSGDPQSFSLHPVPPYTVFTPAGSAYPGSIRCVPDSLGGQRCQTFP